jgi:hypothetical protein
VLIEITEVKIMTGNSGPDIIWFNLNKPSGCWPYEENGLQLKAECANGKGKEYVTKNFPNLKSILFLDLKNDIKKWEIIKL